MATASVPLKHLEDVTECPLCLESFTDSRVLPCIHTFCLQCIKSHGSDKKPGDKISCPLCREKFTIPEGGISGFPKNFFVEKLLGVKSLASDLSHKDSVCDVCTGDGEKSGNGQQKKAVVYCVECRKNMCEECHRCHKQFKLQGSHKLIELNKSPLPVDDLLLKFPETSCDKHPDEILKIYCFDCKIAVCMMCYIKGHNSHKCSDVKEVAGDLVTHMSADTKGIKVKIEDCKSMVKKIDEEDLVLIDDVENAKKKVDEKVEKMKQLIDQQRSEVLDKLDAAKSRQLKANENVKEELRRQIVIMKSFICYSAELKEKGSACDIVKAAEGLRAKGEELLKFDVEVDLPVDYTFTKVKFEATFSEDDVRRIFGDVDITVSVKGKILKQTQWQYFCLVFFFCRPKTYTTLKK